MYPDIAVQILIWIANANNHYFKFNLMFLDIAFDIVYTTGTLKMWIVYILCMYLTSLNWANDIRIVHCENRALARALECNLYKIGLT